MNTAVAGQKGRERAEQGNARQEQGKSSGMAGRLRRPIIIISISLSIAPERGTLDAHKKRSGITYVTYMVVTPLLVLSIFFTHTQSLSPPHISLPDITTHTHFNLVQSAARNKNSLAERREPRRSTWC